MDYKNFNEMSNGSRGAMFVRRLLASEKRIYAFILTLVANVVDADDVMQDTVETMWRKFDSSTDDASTFAAWGVQIAHYKVMEYRRKSYEKRVVFNSEVLNTVAKEAFLINETVDERFEIIQESVQKLKKRDYEIVYLHYVKGETVKFIARQFGVSINAIYKALSRIHEFLFRDYQRALVSKGIR
jgi:RNA polymerase sigma-70 factor (ECF subfamily)